VDAGLPLHSPIATAEPPEQKARKRAPCQQSSGGVFRHPAMMALAAMQDMEMPIWNFQRHLVKQACLYTQCCHGSRSCRGGVIRSAFRFRLAKCPRWIKLRRTQSEQMSSGLPLKADITQYCRHEPSPN
jgi:hypothetical protein